VVIVAGARTLELIADGDLEFGAIDIFENEASPASNADQVKFLHIGKSVLNLLDLEQVVLLRCGLRHHEINIIWTIPYKPYSIHAFWI